MFFTAIRTVIVLTLLLAFNTIAHARSTAKPVRPRVVGKVNVKQRIQPPTFTPASWPRIVNRGRHLFIGRGLLHDHQSLFLMEARRGRRVTVTAPVNAYVGRHPRRFPLPARRGRVPTYETKKLLYYDKTNREAGLLMTENCWPQPARYFHLYWDLAKGRIRRADYLGNRGGTARWISVNRIGYSPAQRTAYLQVVERVPGAGATPPPAPSGAGPHHGRGAARWRRQRNWGREVYRVRVMAVGRRKMRTIASFRTQRRLPRGPFYDAPRQRALLVEYAEGRADRPTGYLVNLRTGRIRRLAIPLVTYGAAFTADGQALLLYGAKRGDLWRFDLQRWRRTLTRRVGSLGHGLGFPFADSLLVLRHRHLHLVDPLTLRERQRISTAQFYAGFSHIEGSVVGNGAVWLRNKPWIYLIRLTR